MFSAHRFGKALDAAKATPAYVNLKIRSTANEVASLLTNNALPHGRHQSVCTSSTRGVFFVANRARLSVAVQLVYSMVACF